MKMENETLNEFLDEDSSRQIDKQIIQLIYHDNTTAEIARGINRSLSATKKRIVKIKRKLGVKTRAGIIGFIFDNFCTD